MAEQRTISREELQQKIVALAWKDDAFRASFLADPKAEFEKTLGQKLPPKLKMTAHAEDENNLYFVIPAKPPAEGELSDDELESVAGGITPTPATPLIVTAIVSATSLVVGATLTPEEKRPAEQKKEGW